MMNPIPRISAERIFAKCRPVARPKPIRRPSEVRHDDAERHLPHGRLLGRALHERVVQPRDDGRDRRGGRGSSGLCVGVAATERQGQGHGDHAQEQAVDDHRGDPSPETRVHRSAVRHRGDPSFLGCDGRTSSATPRRALTWGPLDFRCSVEDDRAIGPARGSKGYVVVLLGALAFVVGCFLPYYDYRPSGIESALPVQGCTRSASMARGSASASMLVLFAGVATARLGRDSRGSVAPGTGRARRSWPSPSPGHSPGSGRSSNASQFRAPRVVRLLGAGRRVGCGRGRDDPGLGLRASDMTTKLDAPSPAS